MALFTHFPKIRNKTFTFAFPLSLSGFTQMLYLPEELNEPSTIDKIKYFFTKADEIMDLLSKATDWIKHFDIHVLNGTTYLLSWTYQFLSEYVLMTPTILFSGEWFTKASIIFGIIGVLLTMLLTVVDGIKSTLNSGIEGLGIKSKLTDINKILKRLPIVVGICGFAPIIFEKSFSLLNNLSMKIVHAGGLYLNTERFQEHANQLTASAFDTVALLGVDIAIITFLVPLVLQTARRWFDILALGAITPLVASCWIFDEHRGYFDKWWSAVKKISFMQLYYAIFVTIMGMIAVGIQETTTNTGLFIKILVIVGGLYRLLHPPSELKAHLDHGDNVIDIYKDFKNVLKPYKPKDNGDKNDKNNNGKKKSILRKHREAKVKRERFKRKWINRLFK